MEEETNENGFDSLLKQLYAEKEKWLSLTPNEVEIQVKLGRKAPNILYALVYKLGVECIKLAKQRKLKPEYLGLPSRNNKENEETELETGYGEREHYEDELFIQEDRAIILNLGIPCYQSHIKPKSKLISSYLNKGDSVEELIYKHIHEFVTDLQCVYNPQNYAVFINARNVLKMQYKAGKINIKGDINKKGKLKYTPARTHIIYKETGVNSSFEELKEKLNCLNMSTDSTDNQYIDVQAAMVHWLETVDSKSSGTFIKCGINPIVNPQSLFE